MPSEKIIQLHQALVARGLATHVWGEKEHEPPLVELPLLNGALARGELAELWAAEESSGATLVMVEILHALALQGQCLALVDGSDSFDPEGIAPVALERLLWVRASTAGQAIKAADLLLRDGNLPLILVQLRGLPIPVLRRIP
ncbi:MAG: hypothetical protein ACO1QR_12885, partial [Chthoniobacteraceae bacterium]